MLISKAMKRFVLQVIAFFAIVAMIDVACGYVFRYMEDNAKGGFTLRDRYISKELKTDVLLYGSSRCAHHYNPQIFEDSLDMACYNAGQDGSGVILSYGRLLMQNKRQKPKVVICDVNPEFDLLMSDNHRFLHWLKSYYHEEGVNDIFNTIDGSEKYKMLSGMYCYNSRFIEVMTDYLHPIFKSEGNGFVPNGGEMNKRKIKARKKVKPEFDPVKIQYIEKLIDESKDSRLVFVVSPIWYGMDDRVLEPIREICKRRDIELYEFENSPKYVHNNYYFYDGNHLNSRGADEFTRDLIADINNMHTK